jgi:DNA-binding winged helix-turn-helix (wHTH) protein
MTTREIHPRVYVFGEFTLDVRSEDVCCPRGRVHLTPRLFRLLLYFVENRGRMVSKEEILDNVWPRTTVSEGSVSRAVASLRRVLEDCATSARLIETVPWRGYRFIADVESRSNGREITPYAIVCGDRSYPLNSGENIIGRDPECDVQLLFPSISRHHAKITISCQQAFIEDLGSKNGTFIGEQRLEGRAELPRGHTLRLGTEELRLVVETDSTWSGETPPPPGLAFGA